MVTIRDKSRVKLTTLQYNLDPIFSVYNYNCCTFPAHFVIPCIFDTKQDKFVEILVFFFFLSLLKIFKEVCERLGERHFYRRLIK